MAADQGLRHRPGPARGQIEVEIVAAGVVGVTDHEQAQGVVGLEQPGDLRQGFGGFRPDLGLVEVKRDAVQGDTAAGGDGLGHLLGPDDDHLLLQLAGLDDIHHRDSAVVQGLARAAGPEPVGVHRHPGAAVGQFQEREPLVGQPLHLSAVPGRAVGVADTFLGPEVHGQAHVAAAAGTAPVGRAAAVHARALEAERGAPGLQVAPVVADHLQRRGLGRGDVHQPGPFSFHGLHLLGLEQDVVAAVPPVPHRLERRQRQADLGEARRGCGDDERPGEPAHQFVVRTAREIRGGQGCPGAGQGGVDQYEKDCQQEMTAHIASLGTTSRPRSDRKFRFTRPGAYRPSPRFRATSFFSSSTSRNMTRPMPTGIAHNKGESDAEPNRVCMNGAYT